MKNSTPIEMAPIGEWVAVSLSAVGAKDPWGMGMNGEVPN